jgi:hypothetical protein
MLNGNALHAAAVAGRESVVQLLIENGADVNAQGGQYGNALHAAVLGGHKGIVQLLLEKGADVNAIGPWGNPLQAASFHGHEELVRLLLEKGADPNLQGSSESFNVFYGGSANINGEHNNTLKARTHGLDCISSTASSPIQPEGFASNPAKHVPNEEEVRINRGIKDFKEKYGGGVWGQKWIYVPAAKPDMS